MITLNDVNEKKIEIFKDRMDIQNAFNEFFLWLKENADNMDEEAGKYIDELNEKIFDQARKNLSLMEDTAVKRKATRLVHQGLDQHSKIQQFTEAFGQPPQLKSNWFDLWHEIMLEGSQHILDLLFDVRQSQLPGHELVKYSLLSSSLDEFISYIHLSKYLYFTQANAHLRTIYEVLLLIDLFQEHPDLMGTWFDGSWKEKEDNFSPSKIRKKLGREKFDPMYGYLCENGSHSTSQSFGHRTLKEVQSGKIVINIGGTKREDICILSNALGILVMNLTILKIIGTFSNRLNFEEVKTLVKDYSIKSIKFSEVVANWAKENDLNIDEFVKSINVILQESQNI